MTDLTPEEEETLKELAGAYQTAKRAGKAVAVALVGILGFVVLLSQAWEVVKVKFGLH
jgi:hypothetical protein